jgi:hypothetical protein
MNRYVAFKRRHEMKCTAGAGPTTQRTVRTSPASTTATVQSQTDMTISDISALEDDYQKRMKEVAEFRTIVEPSVKAGIPDEMKLESDEQLLKHYTGLSNYTTLKAIFDIVSSAIPHNSANKLTHFHCFLLTMMRLRLHLTYYDLGYRFGISEATASRIFAKWNAYSF